MQTLYLVVIQQNPADLSGGIVQLGRVHLNPTDRLVVQKIGQRAREKKAECDSGKISLEEYVDWLKES